MPERSWLLARSWIPGFAIAAVLLAPPGVTLQSSYTLRWLAAGLVLVAAIGRRRPRVALTAAALGGAGGLLIAAYSAVQVLGGGNAARWFYVAGGLVVLAMSLWQVWAGARDLDPVLLVAIQLAVGLLAYWLFSQFSGLALDYRAYAPDTIAHTAGIELSLLALALAAAGLGVYRTWRPAAARLGWSRVEPWHVAVAVLVAALLLLSNLPLDLLMARLTPGSQHAIARIFVRVFSGVPWWSFPMFALMAGIGEETLFRGALQPRFGIVATAALFALIHVQYGPTLVLALVFVHGLIYGLIRRHISTTTAVLTHATYDFAAFLPGLGILLLCGVAALMALLLWGPAVRNRSLIWSSLTQGLNDERKARRLRSYWSRPWKSPPSSTD